MNGRRDVCQLTDQRVVVVVGPLQMHPEPPLHPGTPSLPPSFPPDEWGSRYQLCHHAGVAPNPPASCAFQTLKASLPYLMIPYDFFCCAFVGLEARWPLFSIAGSAKSMAAELEKIRSGPNCVYTAQSQSVFQRQLM